jgi:hypothetical protein
MAKLDYGVFTKGRNKFGPAVSYIRGGVQVVREYVKNVRNPRTKKQMLQRMKFSEMNKVSNAVKPAITIGLANVKRADQTARNKFYQLNKNAVSGDTPDEVTFDYTQMIISQGGAIMPGFGSARADEALTIDVTWVANSDVPGAGVRDMVYLAVFQPDTKTCVLGGPFLRSAASGSVSVPSGWSGMRVHVYGFAVADEDHYETVSGAKMVEKGECTDTAYLGNATVI